MQEFGRSKTEEIGDYLLIQRKERNKEMGSKLTRFLSRFKEFSLVLEREYISATRKLKGSWPFFLKREKVWKERTPFLERERENLAT
jgi:hypothetical protein